MMILVVIKMVMMMVVVINQHDEMMVVVIIMFNLVINMWFLQIKYSISFVHGFLNCFHLDSSLTNFPSFARNRKNGLWT